MSAHASAPDSLPARPARCVPLLRLRGALRGGPRAGGGPRLRWRVPAQSPNPQHRTGAGDGDRGGRDRRRLALAAQGGAGRAGDDGPLVQGRRARDAARGRGIGADDHRGGPGGLRAHPELAPQPLGAISRGMTAALSLIVNGESRQTSAATVAQLIAELDLKPEKVAVEQNGAIVPRSTLGDAALADGDVLEIVHFVGGGSGEDTWTVAGRAGRARLSVGTGKYIDFAQNAAALESSGAEIVTVAVRRVNVSDPKAPMLTDFIDPKKVTYLPNTAGCFTADEAVRTLRLAREAGGWDLVKLEVLGEARTLYPDMRETLRATETLASEGFLPMVYCTYDPISAKQLEVAGAGAVMPLGAPIGSGLGIQNRVTIRLSVEGARVPVLVDAGVGTASDAAVAMELGCDGVLMNTAIAEAKDPIGMARAK